MRKLIPLIVAVALIVGFLFVAFRPAPAQSASAAPAGTQYLGVINYRCALYRVRPPEGGTLYVVAANTSAAACGITR